MTNPGKIVPKIGCKHGRIYDDNQAKWKRQSGNSVVRLSVDSGGVRISPGGVFTFGVLGAEIPYAQENKKYFSAFSVSQALRFGKLKSSISACHVFTISQPYDSPHSN